MTTNKLDGIKPGDRVRVTFEGVVDNCEGQRVSVVPDDGEFPHLKIFQGKGIAAPTFQIERIERKIAIGDLVRLKGGSDDYTVVQTNLSQACLMNLFGSFFVEKLADLERVTR